MGSGKGTALLKNPSILALLAAVTQAIKAKALRQPNGGNPMWWPQVALVMSHITGAPWSPKDVNDAHRRRVRVMPEANQQAMAAGVDPTIYRDAVAFVLEHGRAPEVAPPVVPGLNASSTPKADKVEKGPEQEHPDIKTDVLIRKLQMKLNYWKEAYEQLRDEKATAELIVEAIQEAVVAVEPVEPIHLPAPSIVLWNRPRVFMPVVSDMHVAEKVDGSKIKGFNEHNMHILDEKLDMWCTAIEEQFQYQRALGPVTKMQIPVIGDMVTGESIYRGQQMHIEASAMHQIFIGSDKFGGALLRLARLGVPVELLCVFGNHGRMGKKGESDFSNDILMYKYMQAKLSHQPNITMKIDWAFWETSKHWDWRFYFCHGDNIKGWGGFPWYGQARADANTLMLMLTRGQWYHFFVHGHFHTDMSLQTPIGRRLANGNWIGTTEYGVNGGFAGRPSQKLLVVTEENGIEMEMPIYLDRIEPDFMKQMLQQEEVAATC